MAAVSLLGFPDRVTNSRILTSGPCEMGLDGNKVQSDPGLAAALCECMCAQQRPQLVTQGLALRRS